LEHSPVIRQRVDGGNLKIVPVMLDTASGQADFLD